MATEAIKSDWLAQVSETVVEPERRIIDPHHHLWRKRSPYPAYLVEDLWRDTGSGHNVEKTVFVECHAEYRESGPEHLRCLGETEFVTEQAEASEANSEEATIAAITGHADLTLGESVEQIVETHIDIAKGRFRGIRHSAPRDPNPDIFTIKGRGLEGQYARSDFRQGVKTLGKLGLVYETWHYHHQNPDYVELAQAVPETTMILDHMGTPIGIGHYASKREEIFQAWKRDVAEIARCPNVYAKLGGMAMPDNGFGWDHADRPPTSDEFISAQKRYHLHMIECFGPERCMFESNFPVDKRSLSYLVLFNAFKKMVMDFSEDEKDRMFYGTAAEVYRI